ncbi:MAG: VOC family protein [Proteobacteria bacterium]|nr:VOC family protein [Pseudomonadota bacterium]MDA1022969.1 VOC family protein [Pseudomonadota bacterium]
MTNAIGGFDHVIVGVADLEAARDTYRRLGFTLSPRGRHFGWGTANYCIMFDGDYIELLGIVDASQFTNNLDKKLAESGEGLMSLSYATQDAGAAYAALKALGAEPPKPLSRALELPSGEVEPRFELVHLLPQATPGAPSFVIRHLTPDLVWQAQWLDHANGATAIASATVRVEDLDEAAGAYGKLFGTDAVSGSVVRVGKGCLYLQPAGPDAPPGPVGFEVKVSDIDQTAAVLEKAGIAFERQDREIKVAAGDACGVALVFSA